VDRQALGCRYRPLAILVTERRRMNANEETDRHPVEPSDGDLKRALRGSTSDLAPYKPKHEPLWNNFVTKVGLFFSTVAVILLLTFFLMTLVRPQTNPRRLTPSMRCAWHVMMTNGRGLRVCSHRGRPSPNASSRKSKRQPINLCFVSSGRPDRCTTWGATRVVAEKLRNQGP